jgi:hypothetical protein
MRERSSPHGEPPCLGQSLIYNTFRFQGRIPFEMILENSLFAYVDPSGVGMHHLESRIGGLQAAGQLFALLPVQRSRACNGHAGTPLRCQTRGRPGCDGV